MSPCASCQMCCRSETKPIRPAVFLTEAEIKRFGFDSITYTAKDGMYKCKFLAEDGCTLGDTRPLMCKLWPLVPEEIEFSVSDKCPHTSYFNTTENHNIIKTLTIVDRLSLNRVKGREKGIA